MLDDSRGIEWTTWFTGARLNLANACVHRWARERPGEEAAVGHGEDGTRHSLTWAELSHEVVRFAEGLASLGVTEGDTVGLFLPMSPQAAIASHACAHIGAVQVPIFSGFAAPAVAARLADADAKVLVTADGTLRRGASVGLKEIADEALASAPSVESVVVWQRLGSSAPLEPGRDHDWDELVADRPGELAPLEVESEAPYLLAYTSGTTGRPKGALHVQGGFLLSIAREAAYQADLRAGDRVLFATDMGWIMGPWTVVGAGAVGAAVVFLEGAPDWPADRIWRAVESERVTMLGVSPTLVRALIPKGEPTADLSSLRAVTTTGEPWNRGPYDWLNEHVCGGGRIPIVNISGGTEVGACFLSVTPMAPAKPCSLGFPALGLDMDVVDDAGRSAPGRGRRARLQARVARHDPRDLARSRALPRDLLESLPRRLDARRLGLDRRGRLLVPARPLGRHAQHRREAHRAGGARVGRGEPSGGGGGSRDRRPARRQGRGGVALLRARARCFGRRGRRRASGGGRARQGVPAGAGPLRLGPAEDAQREDRAPRRAGDRARAGSRGRVHARESRRRSRRSPVPSDRLEGVALVTGGGRGIGASIARELADAGMQVAVTGRTSEQVEAVAAEVGGLALVGDVSRAEDVECWVERTESELGPIDLLVANAGIGNQDGATWEVPVEDWWHVLEVNLLGVHLSCRAALPRMLERGRGRIVITGSGAAYLPGIRQRLMRRARPLCAATARRWPRSSRDASPSSSSAPAWSGRR